jgi:hypothetical protein
MVTSGEKKLGSGPPESATTITRAAPTLWPSPNAIQLRVPLAAAYVVSVSGSEVTSSPNTASTSLLAATALATALSGMESVTTMAESVADPYG